MSTRSICVVTGTRAEFGLLSGLVRLIEEDPDLRLQLVATGMHLSPDFGATWTEIVDSGFEITESIEMLLASDTAVGVSKSVGLGVLGFADCFRRLTPDLLVVLGDRFEVLAAAQAAMIARIPIAHIHGGESTEGLIDEAIRHAVTKMSHLHFVAAEQYRRRVIQLGESPDRVYNVGAPGLDHLAREPMSRAALEERLGHQIDGPLAVVTHHPVTLAESGAAAEVAALLRALARVPDLRVVFTGVNADPDGRSIASEIRRFAEADPSRRSLHASLGHAAYLALLAAADVCVGNSSSGLIEAPAVGTPTVNIGARQRGRVQGPTVLQADGTEESILDAIETALSAEFRAGWPSEVSPYGGAGASQRIFEVIKRADLEGILMKRFFDLEVTA